LRYLGSEILIILRNSIKDSHPLLFNLINQGIDLIFLEINLQPSYKESNPLNSSTSRHNLIEEVTEIINRETEAWNTKNAELLMTIFHHDMVWPWPRTPLSHDPMDWVIPWGKYNCSRWKGLWQGLFDAYELVHNHRVIKKIEISEEGDGAFAVIDIDTLWRDEDRNEDHWIGRVCKVYSKCGDDWKMTMHTGVLDYSILEAK